MLLPKGLDPGVLWMEVESRGLLSEAVPVLLCDDEDVAEEINSLCSSSM